MPLRRSLCCRCLICSPGLRATLWAHLEHLSRENGVGISSLGYNLSSALRERFQIYALLAYEGAPRAKDFQRLKLPAIAFPIAAAPPTLEGALASSAKDGLADVTYWNFGLPSCSNLALAERAALDQVVWRGLPGGRAIS